MVRAIPHSTSVQPAATREEPEPRDPEPVVQPAREEASEAPRVEQGTSEPKPAGESAAAEGVFRLHEYAPA